MGRSDARPMRAVIIALSLLAVLCHAQPTSNRPRRIVPPARPFGVVVLPVSGAVFSPSEAFHFQYAMATKSGNVIVEIVSTNLQGQEENRLVLAEFLGTADRKIKGVVDAWLGLPSAKELGPVYDGMAFKLVVTESQGDFMGGKQFRKAPKINMLGHGAARRPSVDISHDLEELDEEVEELEDWRRSKAEHERKEHPNEIDAELRFQLFVPLVD